jgi:hypothetical protein
LLDRLDPLPPVADRGQIALGPAGLNWETARAKVDDANRVLGALSVIVTVAIGVWLWRRRERR